MGPIVGLNLAPSGSKLDQKVLQYGDDMNGILPDKGSARHFLDTVKEYGLYSGPCLNITKTEGMWLGIYRHTHVWSTRNRTLYGGAQSTTTFLISQFLFVRSAIAAPQKVYNLVNSLTFKFIWKSKSERLKINVLIKDYGRGGLKIPDFKPW